MNWDKIEQLLRVAEGAVKFGAPLRPIHDAAMKELHAHANPPAQRPKPTIAELEEILKEPDADVTINPDGTVTGASITRRRLIDG